MSAMTRLQGVVTLTVLLAVTVSSHELTLAAKPWFGSFTSNPHAPAPTSLAMGGFFRGSNHLGGPLVRGLLRGTAMKQGSQMLRRGAGKIALQANSFRVDVKTIGSKTITLARSLPKAWTSVMKSSPVMVCGALEGTRYFVGDIFAQRIEVSIGLRSRYALASSDMVDAVTRLAVLTVWGMFYGSGLGYWSYHELYPRIFGSVGTMAALKTTVFDLTLTCPFVYWPMWHFYKTATDPFVEKSTSAAAGVVQQARDVCATAWTNYRTTFVSDSLFCAAVWGPLHMINFRFVPLHQRFPFIAVSGIIWTTIFSYLQFRNE